MHGSSQLECHFPSLMSDAFAVAALKTLRDRNMRLLMFLTFLSPEKTREPEGAGSRVYSEGPPW